MSQEVIARERLEDKTITIFYDEYADDPRKYDDCLGTMACFHKRYDIGDEKHRNEDPFEFQEWVTTSKDIALYLPIYMLDHSGLTIRTYSFDDPWDSGLLGYIYVTKDEVREWYQRKKITKKLLRQVEENLLYSVKKMDYWLIGEVYCVILEKGDEVVDSMCGIYGFNTAIEVLERDIPEEFMLVAEKLSGFYRRQSCL